MHSIANMPAAQLSFSDAQHPQSLAYICQVLMIATPVVLRSHSMRWEPSSHHVLPLSAYKGAMYHVVMSKLKGDDTTGQFVKMSCS